LIISALISISAMLVQKFPELLFSTGHAPSLLKAFVRAYGPHFYFFFVLGMVLRKKKLSPIHASNYALPFLSLCAVIALFYLPNEALSLANFFFLNGFLLLLLLKIALQKPLPHIPSVEALGVHSLGLYLWHVLPIQICHMLIPFDRFWPHYTLSVALQVLFVISYFYLIKSSFLKKYFFGVS
jgi:acyltransferase